MLPHPLRMNHYRLHRMIIHACSIVVGPLEDEELATIYIIKHKGNIKGFSKLKHEAAYTCV